MENCLVNVTVTSFNRLESTKRCLEALKKTKDSSWRLTVVDNNSADGSVDYLTAQRDAGAIDTLLLCRRNVGVAVAANLGWAAFPAAYYELIHK